MTVRSYPLDSLASCSLRMPQPRQENLILLKLFGHARSERVPRTFRRPSRLSSERAGIFIGYLIQFSKKRGKFSTSKCKDPMVTSRQGELRGRSVSQRGDPGKETRCRSSNFLLPAAEVNTCAGKGCAPQPLIDDRDSPPSGEWLEQATAMTLSYTACCITPLGTASCAGHPEQIAQDDPRGITQPERRLPFNICNARYIARSQARAVYIMKVLHLVRPLIGEF
jgi:hypothetical protein